LVTVGAALHALDIQKGVDEVREGIDKVRDSEDSVKKMIIKIQKTTASIEASGQRITRSKMVRQLPDGAQELVDSINANKRVVDVFVARINSSGTLQRSAPVQYRPRRQGGYFETLPLLLRAFEKN
jgi:hypothetical protein